MTLRTTTGPTAVAGGVTLSTVSTASIALSLSANGVEERREGWREGGKVVFKNEKDSLVHLYLLILYYQSVPT